MVDQILFDLKCLSMGLPPLFAGGKSAASMVFNLPPEERRKASRKIRKIAKAEINFECAKIKNKRARLKRRDRMEKVTNLGSNKQAFSKKILESRLFLVRCHVMRTASSAHKE